MLGIARDSEEVKALMASNKGSDPPPAPQLYSAPDPEEDFEAQVLQQ
jgi:hypothetical protein